MIRFIIILLFMHASPIQADVVHHVRFCTGKYCADQAPQALTIAQQIYFNQQFRKGNLVLASVKGNSDNIKQSNQIQLANSTIRSK